MSGRYSPERFSPRVVLLLVDILYNVALFLLLTLGSPWWLYLFLRDSRFREGLGERFFGVSAEFAAALPVGPRIWIHAVSVGEVLAISGLVRELAVHVPGYTVIVSTTTRTGHTLACERFGAARCFYYPLDFSWAVAKTLHRIAPAMFILAESEFWPNMLSACARRDIPVMVVNARISDRSLPKYLRLRALWQPFLRTLSMVYAQTTQDADRLRRIGVPADRIEVGGNLKFDIRPPQDAAIKTLLQRHLPAGAKTIVCGSTLEGEEAMLLAAWPQILSRIPTAVLLLAPRHPERFGLVAGLLAASSSCVWTQRSQWINAPQPLPPGSIFLLDSIGELAALYALARVAFIGGSLVPAGGHNPLEAAQFGVAIVVGPHTGNFRAIMQLLEAQDAVAVVQPARVAAELIALLLDDARATELGANAKRVCTEQAGATTRCTSAVIEMLRARA